jgi:hypothetical protein
VRGSATGTPSTDRRVLPRRECRLPVAAIASDGSTVPCESADVSIGGMRVVGTERIPLGPIRVVIDDHISLEGTVVEEIFDLATGTVIARIMFERGRGADCDELIDLVNAGVVVDATPAAPRTGARARYVLGAAGVIGLLVVSAAVIRDTTGTGSQVTIADRTTATSVITTLPTPDDDPVVVATTVAPAPTPSPTPAPAPVPSQDATPTASTVPTTLPAPPAPADPAPTFVTTTETADNSMTVTIAEDPANNHAASTVGPSAGVDDVRVSLYFAPEKTDTGYAVWVSIENRSDGALTFPGGAEAVIRATDERGVAQEITVRRDDVVELAPGATVELAGVLPLDPGTYEITTTLDVTRSQPSS